jgi:DASS family divalent anion:Na+ symporter
MDKLTFPKPLPTAISVGLALLIWFVIPVPEKVTPEAWHLLALFTGTIAAIIGKALPIGAVSVIAIALVAITEVTRPGKPEGAIADALSGFANPLIWLIAIAVMIAVALTKTGLGTRIGYHFIAMFGKKSVGVAYGLVLSELVIAPVTPSNTARGGAIIHPIMRSIADGFGSSPELGTQKKIGRYLALVNYNTNPITSAMFITATAPNPLIVDLIAKATNSSIQITWAQWALAALLPGLCMLLLMPLVLYLFFPPEIKNTPDAKGMALDALQKLGPMKAAEYVTLGVLALMLLMWAGVPALLLGPAYDLNATTTAMIGLSLLILTGVLEWEDILKAKSAWDTLVWFAALVMMATFLGKLGLIAWFSQSIQTGITGLGLGWVGATVILVGIYFLFALLFCQHHRAHHRHVRRLLRCRRGAGRAADAAGAAAGLLVLADDVADPLRHRHRADHLRLRLHHAERMVGGRRDPERGQPAGARAGGQRLVEAAGLHLNARAAPRRRR